MLKASLAAGSSVMTSRLHAPINRRMLTKRNNSGDFLIDAKITTLSIRENLLIIAAQLKTKVIHRGMYINSYKHLVKYFVTQ